MNSRNVIFLAILLLCFYGCGQDAPLTDKSTTQLAVGFSLAPGAPAQSDITRIDLTVSSPDLDGPQLFPITNIDQAGRTARGLIQLPVSEDVTFSARAFEGECPVLGGLLESIAINSDSTAPIVISLSALQIVIGVRSEQEQLSVGDSYVVEVYVEDAPRLTALTCELGVDEELLEPQEVLPGDFFGSDPLFIEDSELPRREQNRLSLGITLKGDDTGVCGSGVVFRITFEAVGSGTAEIAVLEDVTLMTSDFEPFDDSSRISIEPGLFIRIE